MTKQKLVTGYQTPSGQSIYLTDRHEAALAGRWPRNGRGEEYCSVSHGAHWGHPSFSDAEIAEIVAGATPSEVEDARLA